MMMGETKHNAITQCDAVLCEDERTVFFYLYSGEDFVGIEHEEMPAPVIDFDLHANERAWWERYALTRPWVVVPQ
jgi:hypothetical protein